MGQAQGDYPGIELHHPPLLLNADVAFVERINSLQRNLMLFYRASLYAYEGNRDAWAGDIVAVMRNDRNNPYFRWFLKE